jgi:signal peptidase I
MNNQTNTADPMVRRPVVAVLLSVAATGLGHIYCGRLTKGLILFFISFAFAPIMVWAAHSTASTGLLLMVVGSVVLMLAVFFYAVVDAGLLARRIGPNYEPREYNRWYLYLVMIVIAVGYPSNMSGTIREHVLQAFKIPSTSMAPGILPGDMVLLNKVVYGTRTPQHGDVVVFVYPDDRRLYFIERLVALPGDSIEIKNSKVWINDQPLQYKNSYPQEINFNAKKEAAYLEEQNHRQNYSIMIEDNKIDNMAKMTVPHGHCFVLGDNRAHSRDSRHFGPVPLADVKGRVDYIYWPALKWSRFGKVGEAAISKNW